MRFPRRGVSALLVGLLAATGLVAAAAPAAAEDPAVLGITKDVSADEVVPGQTVDFTINVSCTYSGVVADAGCTNAQVIDQIPAGLTPINVSVNNYSDVDTSIDGQNVTVDFTSPFTDPPGSQGMIQGTTAEIVITCVVDDLPYAADGIPLTNEAIFTATNPSTDPVSDTAVVTPIIDLILSTDVSKSFDPATGMATPGAETTVSIDASNTSDEGITEMVITDPADPTATPSTFDAFSLASLAVTQFPPAADQVQVDVFVDGAWVTGTPASVATIPGGVTLEDIAGVRLTFSSSTGELIESGASAGIDLGLEQRDLGAVEDSIDVLNTVESEVSRDDVVATDQGDATYVITENIPGVEAGKTVTPTIGPHGDEFQAELTAENSWTENLSTISIIEPATGSPGFDSSMSFAGFPSPPEWPAGATSASITYECVGGGTEGPTPFAVDGFPADPTCEVERFRIDFSGDIPPGATAIVDVDLGTDPDDPAPVTQHDNTVGVEGTDDFGVVGEDTADDTFYSFFAVLMAHQDKTIVPSSILGNAGQWIVATLPGGTAPLPTEVPPTGDFSTVPSDSIVIQDPPATSVTDDTPTDSDFWDYFDPTEIADVAILADSTLTVNYWNGTDWVELAGPITGPQTWSYTGPWPDDIGGIQFVFESTDEEGFPPGTELQPNIVFELNQDVVGGDPITFENCGTTTADADNADPALSDPGCDTVTIVPLDPDGGDGDGGTGEYIEKDIAESTVPARTGDEVDATLWWSTGGATDVSSMTLSDIPGPSSAGVADSLYEAFDLVSIAPITPATDPLIQWDAVESVELYRVNGDGTEGWVEASADPCPCDGTFPGYTLSDEEQADTIAVRLVFVEGSARATTTDPTAPPVGSGVARSIDDDRPVGLTFRIRDERRSDGEPVTGHDFYNEDDEAIVRNDAGAAMVVGDTTYTDTGSDVITILDVPLNAGIDKAWTGGPIGDPPMGSLEPENYPSGRVTLTATNLTQARVDSMVVSDPSTGALSPFDFFTLTQFVSMEVPAGTTAWTATLDLDTDQNGVADDALVITSGPDPMDATPLTELTREQLADVVGLTFDYEGRIDPDEQAIIVFDLQLREYHRTDLDEIEPPVTGGAITVLNGADVVVDDAGRIPGTDPATDDDQATMIIEGLSLEVSVDKEFGPLPAGTEWTADGFSQTEPDQSEFGMLLSVTPDGTARTGEVTVTDVDPTFWNAYQFVRFDESFAFVEPVDQIQIDVLVGGDFTAADGELDPGVQTWIEGEPSGAPTLPDGVAPADVQGLRITYSRADGEQWENSESPTQSIPIVVQRRDALLSGGEVPTDMAGNEPAPGETEPGRSTNTIDGVARSYLHDTSGNPLFNVESNPDTGSVLYEHATTAVAVDKNPTGTIPPGSTTAFTLTITNTGDWPLIDPVITDRLPTDDEGPLLIFDPDVDEPYGYVLTGDAPDPANGLPMPEDAADVTATVSGDASEIQFTFPPGTVLEPGQTYVISIALGPRPGVAAGQALTNSFGIVSERPFDECDGVFNQATGECRASTTVDVGEAGADRSGKLVKADNPEHGVIDLLPDDGEDCVPNSDGFYGPGCVPVTAPGETETWRLQLQNTGTLPLERLVAIDVLPAVGDTGAINPVDRGSEWDATLVAAPVGGFGPENDMTVYGTTAAPEDICTDDLQPLTQSCPDGAWTPLGEITDLSQVTALKFDVTFTDEPLQPGDMVAVDIRTRTPAETPGGEQPIAWNTVATGAVTASGSELLPIEGKKVGVSQLTGPLEVLKVVTGDGAGFAPDQFTVHVACTVSWEEDGETVTVPAYQTTLTVTGGEVETLENLPYGAVCEITEDDAGQTSSSTTTAVVGDPADPDPGQVTVTNVYELASLEVSKAVESDAVDQDGEPIVYGPFFVHVRCEFLGEQVWAEGFGPLWPMVGVLNDGSTVTFEGLPAGAECTVRELVTAGAAAVEITMVAGTDQQVVVDGSEGTLELAPESEGDNSALVTNIFESGDLLLEKVVTGPGADIVGWGPFEFDVMCTLPQPGGAMVTWDQTIELSYPDDTSVLLEDVAAGSTCTVIETDSAGADTVTVVPESVVIGADDTVEVTATNAFDTGDLAIAKTITGPGAEQYAPDAFDVTVTCTVEGATVFEETYTLDESNEFAVEILDEIPYGATCVVTEEDAGQTTTTVVPAEVVIGVDPDVEVTNDYQLASLEVSKAVESDAVDQDGQPIVYGPFEIEVRCTFLGEEVWGTGYGADAPMDLTVSDGDSVTIEGLPAGADCMVTETETADAAESSVTVTAGADEAVVIDGATGDLTLAPETEGDNAALVTNVFDVGDLLLEKVVTGPGADIVGWGPFEFDVYCTLPQPEGDIVTWDGQVELTYPDGTSELLEDIAAGSTCTVTETDSAGADVVSVVPESVVIGADDTVEVTATNAFNTGDLAISKAITGGGAHFAPDAFVVTVVCTVEGATVFEETYTLDQSNDFTVEILDEIPYGAACVVTEEDAGETVHVIAPGTAVIGVDDEVTVLNQYSLADLAITKEVDSEAVDAEGEPLPYGPFLVRVHCTFLDGTVWAEGHGPLRPMIFLLSDGDVIELEGLPAGAECTVTELIDGGAVSTTVTVTEGRGDPATVDGGSGTLVLTPVGAGGNSATVTNSFEVGALTLTKTVTGPGAEELGAGPFVFSILCTLPQPGGEMVAWDGEVTLGGDSPLTATIEDIAAGATCDIAEIDNGGADTVTVEPGTVVIAASETVEVTADNWFAAPPVVDPGGEDLSTTGFTGTRVALAALALLLSGAMVLIGVRRRVRA